MAKRVLSQYPVNSNIDDIVTSLIESAFDDDERVRNSITASLIDIGRFQPNLVLSGCAEFLKKELKAQKGHRVILLTVIEKIVEYKREQVPNDLAQGLVDLAVSEMIREKEVVPDWQGAASQVLVALSRSGEASESNPVPPHIISRLLEQFKSGTLPHYFVIKTLGDLASANPMGIVPQLKDVLARVLPVLASIKHDNMRWAFAFCMGQFCEAIITYMANLDQAKDRSWHATNFSAEVFTCYEFMFSNWLTSQKRKVRLTTIQAIGSMCAIMSRDQFESQLPRLVNGILNMYKKEKDVKHLPITQGFYNILSVATRDNSTVLETHLPNTLALLHQLVCSPSNLGNPMNLKNFNELLRCFEIIGHVFTDSLLSFLLTRLQTKEPRIKEGTLHILRHLVNRLETELEVRKELLLSGLQPLVTVPEPSLQVRKALAQTVIAMASHDYLLLEGGERMVEFIVRNCAITEAEVERHKQALKQRKPGDVSLDVGPGELRDMCDHVLHLMTTTIPSAHKVLWPYLFEALAKPELTASVPIVSKSIAALARTKREQQAPDYFIDFDRAVNLPKPQMILTRLLVLSHLPPSTYSGKQANSTSILEALQQIAGVLHPSIQELWDNSVPVLVKLYGSAQWSESKWEEYLLRLLSETIKLINDDEWSMRLGDALSEQLRMYKESPFLKRIALKHLGVVLQLVHHKEFIRRCLDTLFSEVDHNQALERQGCAQALGYAANAHLDAVLEKTQSFVKSDGGKGSGGGLFGLFKGSSSEVKDGAHINTIILALGYVAAYANPVILPSRVDVHVINTLKQFTNTRNQLRRESLITAIDLVGKAVHLQRLGAESRFVLKSRDELLLKVIEFILPERPKAPNGAASPAPVSAASLTGPSDVTHSIRVLGLNACATLIDLDPPISAEVEQSLMTAVTSFYSLDIKPEDESSGALIFENINRVLTTLLLKDTSTLRLERVLTFLEPALKSARTDERTRSLTSALTLFKTTAELLTSADDSATQTFVDDSRLRAMGGWIGALLPRTLDVETALRSTALAAIRLVLFVDWALQARVEKRDLSQPPEALTPIAEMRKRILSDELNEQFVVVGELASILATMAHVTNIGELVLAVGNGLSDHQLSAARGCCVVLYSLIKLRGTELGGSVGPIVELLLKQLAHVMEQLQLSQGPGTALKRKGSALSPTVESKSTPRTPSTPSAVSPTATAVAAAKTSWTSTREVEQLQNGILHALRVFGELHLYKTVDQLLAVKLPHPPHISKALQVFTKEGKLLSDAVDYLTEMINSGELFDDVLDSNKKVKQQVSVKSMAATAALAALLEAEEMESLILDKYAHYFGTIMLRFGTARESTEANQQVITALHNFIARSKDNKLQDKMDLDSVWTQLEGTGPEYLEAVTAITSVVAQSHPDQRRNIFAFILPFMKSNYSAQCQVSATIIAELVNHSKDDKELLQRLINQLLNSLARSEIKLQALRGMSNIVSAGREELNRYSTTVLDALMSNIEDPQDVVALEAMRGLFRVFEEIDCDRIAPVLVNICNRIKPALDKSNDKLREAGAKLLGVLDRLVSSENSSAVLDNLQEQTHVLLPSLVLHVNDEVPAVRSACKETLKRLVPMFSVEELNKVFSSIDPQREIDYNEFLSYLSKALIKAFPTRLNSYVMTCVDPYFKSEWNVIKGNAAMFVGHLFGNSPVDNRKSLNYNPSRVTKELISLMRDKSPLVRQKAADAMALLHTY